MDLPNDEPGSSTQRSQCNSPSRIFYPGQIEYRSGSLPKAADSQAKFTRSQQKLGKFVSSHMAKSHEDMVRVFQSLSGKVDNEGPDEPAT